jgi:hypothetical protein
MIALPEDTRLAARLRGNEYGEEIIDRYHVRQSRFCAALIYEGLTTNAVIITSLLPGPSEVDVTDLEYFAMVEDGMVMLPGEETPFDQFVDMMREAARTTVLSCAKTYKERY